MATLSQGLGRTPDSIDRTEAHMEELVASGHVVRVDNPGVSIYRLTDAGHREAWLTDAGMTTSHHLAAVQEAIRRAGGPDRIRFAPVTVELLGAAAPAGPVKVAISENAETRLVDIVFSEIV